MIPRFESLAQWGREPSFSIISFGWTYNRVEWDFILFTKEAITGKLKEDNQTIDHIFMLKAIIKEVSDMRLKV